MKVTFTENFFDYKDLDTSKNIRMGFVLRELPTLKKMAGALYGLASTGLIFVSFDCCWFVR
jgi:hypothetical protein